MKTCARCKANKPDSEFYSNTRCQTCKSYYDEYYKNNRQQEINRSKRILNDDRDKTNAYKRSLIRKNPVGYMLQRIRSRAKLNNIPFNLTKDDISIPECCPVLGIPLRVSDKTVTANSISLDRIIPELGYVKGNVAVISQKANTIKNNASIKELEQVISWMKTIIKENLC